MKEMRNPINVVDELLVVLKNLTVDIDYSLHVVIDH
jgi:hypothetical protein